MSSVNNSRTVEPSAGDATNLSWLTDLRVLCVGSSVTIAVAARVLARFGADVSAAERAEDVAQKLPTADVVLVDRIESAPALPGLPSGSAADYLAYVASTNKAVWVTTSAYGLATDRADAVGSDVSVLGSAGILGHSRIGEEWAPTIPAGSIGLKIVGDVMALSALHGVHSRLANGAPVHVDVSAQAAVLATGLTLEMAHALLDCPDEGGSARYGAPTGFFDCLDGAVYVVVLEQHQWNGFQKSLAPLLDDVPTVEDARLRHDEVNSALATWAATRTAEECERILQRAGVACTAVNSVEDFITRSSEAGRPFSLGDERERAAPGHVTQRQATRDSSASPHPLPLNQVRVLDAGHVLAVPLAMSWLGAMGASVTKLEDPERLDVYRRRGPFSQGIPGLNRSAYYNAINFSKNLLTVHVDEGERPDLAQFDVVVHNLSPRRAARIGVDGAAVLDFGQPKLSVASSGFGSTGDWANYRAYGHNIHAFAGLVSATRNARGEIADVGTPWCDPLTSVSIATWVAAWALSDKRDETVSVDLSMSEVMISHLADLVGVSAEETYRSRPESRDLFLQVGRSGEVVALTLRGVGDQNRFEQLLGLTLGEQSRRGDLVHVDFTTAEAAGITDAVELEELLLRSGFAAALVQTAHDLALDPFLRSTGLFVPVHSHDLGHYDVVGLPWTFVGSAHAAVRAAPERPVQ